MGISKQWSDYAWYKARKDDKKGGLNSDFGIPKLATKRQIEYLVSLGYILSEEEEKTLTRTAASTLINRAYNKKKKEGDSGAT